MTMISMKQLLEAGVHFGHQSRRWNPKMKRYIYTERNNIYIIDLKKTIKLLREACKFVRDSVAEGKTILFVGTKKQAKESVEKAAKLCNMYYVTNRWLGGTLTNFLTVQKSIKRLLDLERMEEDGSLEQFIKKERIQLLKEKEKLGRNLNGIKKMERPPDILFVIDTHKEQIAIREARKLSIPIVGVVDTNCDPDDADWIIPANDDAIRAVTFMATKISEAVTEGLMVRAEEMEEAPPEQIEEAVKEVAELEKTQLAVETAAEAAVSPTDEAAKPQSASTSEPVSAPESVSTPQPVSAPEPASTPLPVLEQSAQQIAVTPPEAPASAEAPVSEKGVAPASAEDEPKEQ